MRAKSMKAGSALMVLSSSYDNSSPALTRFPGPRDAVIRTGRIADKVIVYDITLYTM
jgi:hypothetical protein